MLVVKNTPANAGDVRDAGSIPGLGRSPGGGHGNPLQYSCLENPRTEEPVRLQTIGSQRVRHDWSDLACMHSPIILCQAEKTSLLRRISFQNGKKIKLWELSSVFHIFYIYIFWLIKISRFENKINCSKIMIWYLSMKDLALDNLAPPNHLLLLGVHNALICILQCALN